MELPPRPRTGTRGSAAHRWRQAAGALTGTVLIGATGGCTQEDSRQAERPSESASESAAPKPGKPEKPEKPTSAPARSRQEQDRLDKRLIAAAWDNDVPRARRLIGQGADVNAQDDTRQSAYLIATSEGYVDLLELTLRHGADVDAKDSFNGTGLIRAADRGHWDIAGRLIRAGIDVDHVNELGWTALHEAIILGDGGPRYVDTVRVLVAAGADVQLPSERDGVTPLGHARSQGYDAILRILGRAVRADTGNARDRSSTSRELLEAASDGDADAVALALRAGAPIDARDHRRRTALLLAVTGDHLAVARLLVALGADPDALDVQHDTPWLVTGVTGSVAMADVLLPADPDLAIRNRYGGVSLIPASERGHVDYVRRVVRTGIDVNHVNDLGWTALLEAVVLGDGSEPYQQIARILIAAGADPEIADADGLTASEHAAARGHRAMARILQRGSVQRERPVGP